MIHRQRRARGLAPAAGVLILAALAWGCVKVGPDYQPP